MRSKPSSNQKKELPEHRRQLEDALEARTNIGLTAGLSTVHALFFHKLKNFVPAQNTWQQRENSLSKLFAGLPRLSGAVEPMHSSPMNAPADLFTDDAELERLSKRTLSGRTRCQSCEATSAHGGLPRESGPQFRESATFRKKTPRNPCNTRTCEAEIESLVLLMRISCVETQTMSILLISEQLTGLSRWPGRVFEPFTLLALPDLRRAVNGCAEKLHLVGIRDTRSRRSKVRHQNAYIVYSSAPSIRHSGVDLWTAKC